MPGAKHKGLDELLRRKVAENKEEREGIEEVKE